MEKQLTLDEMKSTLSNSSWKDINNGDSYDFYAMGIDGKDLVGTFKKPIVTFIGADNNPIPIRIRNSGKYFVIPNYFVAGNSSEEVIIEISSKKIIITKQAVPEKQVEGQKLTLIKID